MLVLSRKKGEGIVIGSNIQVTVLEVIGNRVRLGFVAPDDVSIHRDEVFRRVQSERHGILALPRTDAQQFVHSESV